MASRRRRRRRRGRRRNSAPVGLIAGAVVAVLALAGGGFAYSQGAFENLGGEDTGLSGVSAPSDRFKGAEGIDVGSVTPPNYWWSDIASLVTVDSADPSEVISPDTTPGSQYQRVLVPADLLFAADSSELSDSAEEAVAAIADTVSDPSLKVIVVCHSSADGSEQQRLTLSEERADELASLLEELLQRTANSIVRIGKGDTEPLPGIDQSTASGRALNRRCEVFIQFT